MQRRPWFQAHSTRSFARRSLGPRHGLIVEALEDRRLFTATPLAPTSSLATVDAQVSAADVVAVGADALPGEITLYRQGAPIETFDPATDTDADRGTALRTALAAALPGDELMLGASTYDMGGDTHVEFPAGVTVAGAGQTSTQITSSCPQFNDGAATFTLEDQTVIQDCSLEGTLRNGWYQPLVGIQGEPAGNVTAYLRQVNISGDSDGIFIWSGTDYQYTIDAYGCNIDTNYDAVAVLGSGYNPETVNLYGCSLTVGQDDDFVAHTAHCVNVRSGNVGLYNCTLTATGDAYSVQTNGVLNSNVGSSVISNCTFNVSAPSGVVYDLNIQDFTTCEVIGGQGSGPDGSYISSSGTETYVDPTPSAVVSRSIFYGNSAFDGYNPLPSSNDHNAIARDKTALLPGQTATFANLTSYDKGINGIMIDVAGAHGDITANDFTFRVGNNNSPSTWASAPAPVSVVVLNGAGANGSDRVELTWSDGAIEDEWLEVTMAASADTGLALPDTFFFGNLIGDTGDGDTPNLAFSNATDENATRLNDGTATITNPYDLNRDRFVNSSDENIARANSGSLRYIKILSNTPLAPASVPSTVVPAAAVAIPAAVGIASAPPAVASGVETGLDSGLAARLRETPVAADANGIRSIPGDSQESAEDSNAQPLVPLLLLRRTF